MEPADALQAVQKLRDEASKYIVVEDAIFVGIDILATSITGGPFSLETFVSEYADPGPEAETAEEVLVTLLANKHRLIGHAAVGVWSRFEAFCIDAFGILASAVEIDSDSRLMKVKLPVAQYVQLPAEAAMRLVAERADVGKSGIDRYDGLFRLIDLRPKIGDDDRSYLRELQEVRNVLLHRDGRIDERLSRVAVSFEATIGAELHLDAHEQLFRYSGAATSWMDGLVDAAHARLA